MRIVGEVSVSLGIVGGVVWASATVSVIQVIASASSTGASMGEGNGTAADAADMGAERVAVRDGNDGRERSGEDHFAGTEGHTARAKRCRTPCPRIDRRALAGGAGRGSQRCAIPLLARGPTP